MGAPSVCDMKGALRLRVTTPDAAGVRSGLPAVGHRRPPVRGAVVPMEPRPRDLKRP